MMLAGVLPLNGRAPADHLVDNGAERPDVAPRVGFLALDLLRRHVRHGAQNRPVRGRRSGGPEPRHSRHRNRRRRRFQFRQPEVEQL